MPVEEDPTEKTFKLLEAFVRLGHWKHVVEDYDNIVRSSLVDHWNGRMVGEGIQRLRWLQRTFGRNKREITGLIGSVFEKMYGKEYTPERHANWSKDFSRKCVEYSLKALFQGDNPLGIPHAKWASLVRYDLMHTEKLLLDEFQEELKRQKGERKPAKARVGVPKARPAVDIEKAMTEKAEEELQELDGKLGKASKALGEAREKLGKAPRLDEEYLAALGDTLERLRAHRDLAGTPVANIQPVEHGRLRVFTPDHLDLLKETLEAMPEKKRLKIFREASKEPGVAVAAVLGNLQSVKDDMERLAARVDLEVEARQREAHHAFLSQRRKEADEQVRQLRKERAP